MTPKSDLSPIAKLLLVLLTIGIVVLAAFALGVFGETKVGITLSTNPDLENGLVGHWTFDGPDMLQNVTDKSGQGNHGSLQGRTSTTTTLGKIGQAFEFTSGEPGVNMGDQESLDFGTGDFSGCWWFNAENSGTQTFINDFGGTENGYRFWKTSGADGLRLRVDDGTDTSFSLGDIDNWDTDFIGSWHHFCITADRSGLATSYIDGEVHGTADMSIRSGNIDNTESFFIAANDTGNSQAQGLMDDVRMYNRVLSASEVSRLYELGNTTHVGTTLGAVGSSPNLSTGLVGHWTFDGPDLLNNVTDKSGNGNTGILQDFTSTTTTEGVIGQALDFDGSDDYVNTTYAPVFSASDDISTSFWYKSDNTSHTVDQEFIGAATVTSDGQFFVEIDADGSLCADDTIVFNVADTVTGDIVCSTTVANDTEWHFVVGTFDIDGNMEIYIDGERENTTAVTSLSNGAKDFSSTPFFLGANNTFGSANQFFDGSIDDVRVYNRALSADEVTRLYELGNTTHVGKTLGTVGTSPDLSAGIQGHWTFDGPDLLQNVVDKSGQGNTGYLSGFTSTTTTEGPIGQALEFDGSNDQVSVCTGCIDTSGPISVSFWNHVATADVQASSALGGFGTNSTNDRLQTHAPWSDNTLYWDYGTTGAAGRVTTDYTNYLDKWTHVALVSEGLGGSFSAIYLDGVLVQSDVASDGPSGSVTVDIGAADLSTATYYHSGKLDDVRIYNRVLSADEVTQLYKLGR